MPRLLSIPQDENKNITTDFGPNLMKVLLNTSQYHTWDSQNMTPSYIRLTKAKPTRLRMPLYNHGANRYPEAAAQEVICPWAGGLTG